MSRQHSICHLAIFIILLVTSGTRSEPPKCASPEVTYRDFHISGSLNKTGVWETTLGNIKVVVEHAGKSVMRSLGSGHWEINVKASSTVCSNSATEDTGTHLEETLSEKEEISFRSPDNNISVEFEMEKATDNDEKPFAYRHRFAKLEEELSTSDNLTPDSAIDDGPQDLLSGDINELPEREASLELYIAPDAARTYPRPWLSNGWMTEYADYGEAGVIKLYADSLPWKLARQRCERDGARLVSVDTELKVAALLDVFSRYPRVPMAAVLKNQVYTGVNDRYNEGVFQTVTGELFRPWSESVWFPGEPDDMGGEEDCVTFHTEGKIRDVPCRFSLPFFCELDPSTTSLRR